MICLLREMNMCNCNIRGNKKFPNLSNKDISSCVQKECFTKAARTLSFVFGTAVPWYVIGNVRDTVRAKDAVWVSILMLATLFFTCYYKYNKKHL